MASRKLARDVFLSQHLLLRRHQSLPTLHVSSIRPRLQLVRPNEHFLFRREFSVFSDFSKKIKDEVDRNQELQQSIKELMQKAEELKGVKEDLKTRTKQTTEQLYTRVDGVWTEAEAMAKNVYADVEGKISAATEEVKGSFGIGNQEATGSKGTSTSHITNDKNGSKSASCDNAGTFRKVKLGVASVSPKVSLAFQKQKDAKPIYLVKKGCDIVKDELKGNPNRRKWLQYDDSSAASSPSFERSTRTDIVVLTSKQSPWSNKWEAFKTKMQGNPTLKRVFGFSKPVIEKSREDTIHTVHYACAMQQLDPEDLGYNAPYATWKLREMQQFGVRALI